MKQIRVKFFSWAAHLLTLSVIFALAQGASARWKVEFESGSMIGGQFVAGMYVRGLSDCGATRVYVTTDERTVKTLSFVMSKPGNDAWTWKWNGNEYNQEVVGSYGRAPSSTSATSLRLMVDNPTPNGVAVAANLNRALLATVTYDINVVSGDLSAVFPASWLLSAVHQSNNISIDYKNSSLVDNGNGSCFARDAFNVNSPGASIVEMDEQDGETRASVTIAASDEVFHPTFFSAEDLRDHELTEGVVFTAVQWAHATEADAAKYAEVYGSLDINAAGEIVYTPSRYWYGRTSSILATVKCDESELTKEVAFQVTVRDVPTAPEFSFYTVASGTEEKTGIVWKEGSADFAPVYMDCTDYDGRRLDETYSCFLDFGDYDLSSQLHFVKFLSDNVLDRAGVSDSDDGDGSIAKIRAQYAVSVLCWDLPGSGVPYDIVAHPKTQDDITLTFGGNSKVDGYSNSFAANVPVRVEDTDRFPSVNSIAVGDADGNTGDVVFTAHSTYKAVVSYTADPDGDAVAAKYTWEKRDSSASGSAWVVASADQDAPEHNVRYPKGTLLRSRISLATNPYGQGDIESGSRVSNEIKVMNSQPVVPVTSARIFIRRIAGENPAARSASAEIDLTDADGWSDVLVLAGENDTTETLTGYTASGIGGSASIKRDVPGTLRISYVLNSEVSSAADLSGSFTFWVGDKGDDGVVKAYTQITVNVDYKENPLPVISLVESTGLTVDEVDADGNPSSVTIKVKATDSAAVTPAGVSSWDLVVPEGWTKELISANTTERGSSEAWEGFAEYKFTNKGYDTIDGSPRPMSKEFTVTVKAQDVATHAWGVLDLAVNVNDVDREPTGTPVMNISSNVVAGSTVQVTPYELGTLSDPDGDAITLGIKWFYTEPGSSDRIEVTSDGSSLASDVAVRKGNAIIARAVGSTSPYGDEGGKKDYDFEQEVTVAVGNTVPKFVRVGSNLSVDGSDIPADSSSAVAWKVAQYSGDGEAPEQRFLQPIVAEDADVDSGRDVLHYKFSNVVVTNVRGNRYSVTYEENGAVAVIDGVGRLEVKGTVAGTDPQFAFTPAKDYNSYNGNGLSLPMSFDYNVVDWKNYGAFDEESYPEVGADRPNKARFLLTVSEQNLPPAVKPADQYVMPDQRGGVQTVAFEVDPGSKFEFWQRIVGGEIAIVDDTDSIIDTFGVDSSAADPSENAIKFHYTVKAGAPLGSKAVLKIKALDNGTTDRQADPKESEFVEFTVYVGASPWYPLTSFTCLDPEGHADGHVVRFTDMDAEDSAAASIDLVIRKLENGDQVAVKPGAFMEQGHKGYLPGTRLEVKIFVYSLSAGNTGEICLGEAGYMIPDYSRPGSASAVSDEAITADADGKFYTPVINVPMARDYRLEVLNSDDWAVFTMEGEFQPQDNGLILPEIREQLLRIAAAGTYRLRVTGVNPLGMGPSTVLPVEITVPNDNVEHLEWTSDDFSPAANAVLNYSSVKFSWPGASGAQSYELHIFNGDGTKYTSVTGLTSLNETVELELDEVNARNYSWYVRAVGRNGEVMDSQERSLTVSTRITDFAVTAVGDYGDGIVFRFEGAIDDISGLQVDYQYFTMGMGADGRWYNNTAAGTADITALGYNLFAITSITDRQDGAQATICNDRQVDFVAIRCTLNGRLVSDWTVYQVTPGGVPLP